MGFLNVIKKVASPLTNIFNPAQAKAVDPNLINPFTESNTMQANDATQNAFNNQQKFLNALNAQNGTGNQSSVFAQQQGLANQLGNMAQGGGPNPALAQLNQSTGENVAAQAALMAGQRGSGSNAGLMARLAAQQGGNIMQQAAGQGATLQSQQQLAAINALQNQQQNMSGLASQQVGQQQQGLNTQASGLQAQQNMYMNAVANQNNNAAGVAAQQNQANASNAASKNAITGSLLNAGGGLLTNFVGTPTKPAPKAMAEGGVVPGTAAVPGDHPANDTVAAQLSPGEVVIPRSVLDSPDPANAAMHFVAGLMASKKTSGKMAFGGVAQTDGFAPSPPSESPIWDALQNGEGILTNPAAKEAFKEMLKGGNAPSNYTPPKIEMNNVPAQESAAPANPLMESAIDTAQAPVETSAPAQPGVVQSGLNQGIAGIQQQASAEADLGQKQAALYERQAAAQEEVATSYAESKAKIDQEMSAAQADYASGKIDPGRYISSMSGGQKAVNIIGLILGGLGQGYGGGENVALKLLQKNIDQDIEAQKADMGKKENLLNINFRKYGNLRDAQTMTQAMSSQAFENQLLKAAAQSKDPLAQARAQQAIGELKMKQGAAIDDVARRQGVMGAAQKGSIAPETAVRALVPAGEQKQAFADLAEVKATTNAVQKLKADYKNMSKIGAVSASMPFSDAKSNFALNQTKIRASIGAAMKPILGTMSDSDQKNFIDGFIPQKTDTKEQVLMKMKAAEERAMSGVGPKLESLKGYGINVPTGPQLSPQQKDLAMKAKMVLQKDPSNRAAQLTLEKLGLS